METSVLLIRDAKTGRMAKVEVTENGRDTGLFLGFYQLNFEASPTDFEMTPEVYVVPTQLAATTTGLTTVSKMIQDGKLLRKPFFLRIENHNVQAISVYDTKDQALDAYKGYLKTGTGRQIVDRAAMAAAQTAKMSEQKRASLEAEQKATNERKSLEQAELNRMAELKKKQAEMSEREKADRKAKAAETAAQGMKLYEAEKFPDAEKKFSEATALDPENQEFYFQYGVCLFKTEKYKQSLVVLDAVQPGKVNLAEVDYFRGLNHLKLEEYNNAYQRFLEVKNRNDEALSPTAGFFAGVIDFQNENYDSARGLFEYVLDQSKDPAIDRQAETYIEQIANVKQFQELQKKRFFVNANIGLLYDSNILSQSAANAPTDLAGWRWAYGGSLEYRALYTPSQELSGTISLNDMYSQDKSFQAKTEFQNTDPLVVNLSVPYRYKSQVFGKGYQLSLIPAYETIQMNTDGEGSRETIVNSTILRLDQTFIMSENWFSTYGIEARRDNSLISSTPEESQTASKITLSSSQAYFYDAKKTTALIWDLGFAMNNAEGKNQKYNRIDLGFTYLFPMGEIWSGTTRVGGYNATYADHLVGRADNSYSLLLAARRPIEKLLFFNMALSYMSNQSIEAYTYDKYTIMTSLSWDQNF